MRLNSISFKSSIFDSIGTFTTESPDLSLSPSIILLVKILDSNSSKSLILDSNETFTFELSDFSLSFSII
jgi:hypothetical protein